MEYTIDYGTTTETKIFDCLKSAMDYADKTISYNQCAVKILDFNNKLVAKRSWYECMDGVETCENPIIIGNIGFYDDWQFDF